MRRDFLFLMAARLFSELRENFRHLALKTRKQFLTELELYGSAACRMYPQQGVARAQIKKDVDFFGRLKRIRYSFREMLLSNLTVEVPHELKDGVEYFARRCERLNVAFYGCERKRNARPFWIRGALDGEQSFGDVHGYGRRLCCSDAMPRAESMSGDITRKAAIIGIQHAFTAKSHSDRASSLPLQISRRPP